MAPPSVEKEDNIDDEIPPGRSDLIDSPDVCYNLFDVFWCISNDSVKVPRSENKLLFTKMLELFF